MSMPNCKVEVIAHSIGPNGAEIFTLLTEYPRFIHSEVLRHRNVSHSVASSRAIPAKLLMGQVRDNPAMPVLWPKQHKGMQGTEVFENCAYLAHEWRELKDHVLQGSEHLTELGLSKQLTNRLIEPWVMCRDVMTFTRPQIEGFFMLRHPWYEIDDYKNGQPIKNIVWEGKVNLNFPAEYNIQNLAIEMKKAMDDSEPDELLEGDWHLPFVTIFNEDGDFTQEMQEYWKRTYPDGKVTNSKEMGELGIKLSASRCAMTSYNTNKGRSVEMELDLAERLVADHHWSPFEHQAQAIAYNPSELFTSDNTESNEYDVLLDFSNIPEGLEYRCTKVGPQLWSRNFQGWTQARALMDGGV